MLQYLDPNNQIHLKNSQMMIQDLPERRKFLFNEIKIIKHHLMIYFTNAMKNCLETLFNRMLKEEKGFQCN